MRKLTSLGIAAVGGACGGVFVGLAEAAVVIATGGHLDEYWLLPYAVVSYGGCGCLIGLAYGLASLAVNAVRAGRWRANLLGGAAALALFALGGAVTRYQVVQRVFHEELVVASITGLAVHAGIVLAVGSVAWVVWALGAALERRAHGVWFAALGLLACMLSASAGAELAVPRSAGTTVARRAGIGTEGHPNVILIIADTLRADAIDVYGGGPGATPALDAFAAEAVRFENTYAQASWTRPSIATILTSLYPSAHGAIHKLDVLPDEVTTLAEAFRAQGGWTAGFVSNINVAPIFNFQQGFAEYVYLAPAFYFWATDSATRLAIYKGMRVVRERFFKDRIYFYNYYQDADVVTDAAMRWLEQRPPQPFFLLIHYMDAHDPYFEMPYNGHGVARVTNPDPPAAHAGAMHQLYRQDVHYLDSHLGALFGRLKSLGLYDGTVIAVTADHGEEFQEHGGWWHGTTLYQELVRVPLIIKRAREPRPGSVESDTARSLDISPTLMAAAGFPIPVVFAGRDLFAASSAPPEALLAEEDFEGNVLASLRTGAWKLITANPDNPRGLKPVELYNLDADPAEHHNLAGDEPARTNEMRQRLAQERLKMAQRPE